MIITWSSPDQSHANSQHDHLSIYHIIRPLPDFIMAALQGKIWEWPGNEANYICHWLLFCAVFWTVTLPTLSHSPHCHTPHTVTLPTLSHSPHCHAPHTVTLPTLLHSPHCYTVAIHEETELSRWVGGGADCQKVHETLHDNTSCIHPVLGSR